MSEAEAIDIVIAQFAGETGIVPRLRAGLGLDEAANARVFEALGVLRTAWNGRLRVPKRVVQAFVYVDGVIGEMSPQYEGLDLWALDMGLSERIEKCLEPGAHISEKYEEALASLMQGSPSQRIYEAWIGETGLLMALHKGKGLEALVTADIFDAVAELGVDYSDEVELPRVVDYPLATFSGYIAGRWGIYRDHPVVQEQILALSEDLRKHIIRSLGDHTPTDFRQMKMDLSS